MRDLPVAGHDTRRGLSLYRLYDRRPRSRVVTLALASSRREVAPLSPQSVLLQGRPLQLGLAAEAPPRFF